MWLSVQQPGLLVLVQIAQTGLSHVLQNYLGCLVKMKILELSPQIFRFCWWEGTIACILCEVPPVGPGTEEEEEGPGCAAGE